MTTGVLLATAATEGSAPAALLRLGDATVVSHFAEQLRANGVVDLCIVTKPEWVEQLAQALPDARVTAAAGIAESLEAIAAVAEAARGTLLVASAEIVTHGSVVAGLLADPRVPSGVVSSGRVLRDQRCLRLRTDRGRVVAAESAYHVVGRHSGYFLQMLKVSPADLPALVAVAREESELCRAQLPTAWQQELARKVEAWGVNFFRSRPEGLLAEQLARSDVSADWLPDVEGLRRGTDQRFRSEVLHPAAAAAADAVSLLLVGLTRHGTVLTSTYLRGLYWVRPFTQARVEQALTDMRNISEDRSALASAVKGSDGFFTTYFVSPYSKYIARWCARRGFTPNQVTVVSLLLGALSALTFAIGTRPALIGGAILLQVSFTADCVDGQLARYTRQFSKLGAWLDSVFDRTKEYMVFAGLAYGAVRMGSSSVVWLLAGAALALQTFRHSVDFGYAAAAHQSITMTRQAPLIEPDERALNSSVDPQPALEPRTDSLVKRPEAEGLLAGLARAGVAASRLLERRPWMRWAKRILVLPIGERFALVSLTAAIGGAFATFVALLVWGMVAATYTVAGRALRSLT